MPKKDKATGDNNPFAELAAAIGGEILESTDAVKEWIDTGNLALNYLCSGRFVGGGIPSGKVIEIFGPSSSCKTLFATNILKGCQKAGGFALFLDAENTLNKEFAQKASHLETSKVLVLKADSLERAFAKMMAAIRKIREKFGPEKPIVIVYDSIAASPSDREYAETEMTEEQQLKAKDMPGERAKTISKAMRQLTPLIEESNTAVLFINQVRQRIGVMFGCFHYDSRVQLADGSTMKIGKIVNQKLPVNVMSFNYKTGNIEPKRVVAWHDNGNLQDNECFLQFVVRKRGGNGRTQFACTPNHKIFVPAVQVHPGDKPWREIQAGKLNVGDKMMVGQPYYLTQDQKQLVYGSILGDGSLRMQGDDSCVQLRVGHGIEQKSYCQWKQEIMEPWISYTEDKDHRYCFDTIPMYELRGMQGMTEDSFIPHEVIDGLDVLGLAVWYLDDGTFAGNYQKWGNGKASIYCQKFANRERMLEVLKRRFGLDAKMFRNGFRFDSENTDRLHKLVAPYVHPSMEYKLHPKYRGQFNYEIEQVDESVIRYQAVESEILDIYQKPTTRSKRKFDLTIEDNSTYIVDGAIVHNSPETTTGGNALGFYTSLRLKTKAEKRFTDKLDNVIGMGVTVRNVKNKCFKPFVEARNMNLLFDQGINPFSGLLELLIQTERIAGCGSGTYKVNEPWAGGQEIKFKSALERNDVPLDALLKCPALVDAKSAEEVQEYMTVFGQAVEAMQEKVAKEEEVNEADGEE